MLTYLEQRRAMKQGKTVAVKKKAQPIRAQSEKMKEALKDYGEERKKFLSKHKACQAKLKGCTVKATEVHHKQGRGSNLVNVNTFLAVCRCCHQQIEELDQQAREKGLKESRITKPKK